MQRVMSLILIDEEAFLYRVNSIVTGIHVTKTTSGYIIGFGSKLES